MFRRIVLTITQAVVVALIALIALLLLSFGIGSSVSAPPNAVMYLDEQSLRYYSPPCLAALGLNPNRMLRTTDAEMSRRWVAGGGLRGQLRAAPECADSPNGHDEAGGFVQHGRSLGGMFLQKLGLIPPLESRWRPDGTWKW